MTDVSKEVPSCLRFKIKSSGLMTVMFRFTYGFRAGKVVAASRNDEKTAWSSPANTIRFRLLPTRSVVTNPTEQTAILLSIAWVRRRY